MWNLLQGLLGQIHLSPASPFSGDHLDLRALCGGPTVSIVMTASTQPAWPLGAREGNSKPRPQAEACCISRGSNSVGLPWEAHGRGQIYIASPTRGQEGLSSPVEPAEEGRSFPLQQYCYQRGNLSTESLSPISTPWFPGDVVSVVVCCHTNPFPVRQQVPQG